MEPEKPAATTHILRNNVLGVLAAAVLLGLLSKITDGKSTALFAFGYGMQVLINVVLGFMHLKKGAAPYFLSALLVLLIGFGACSYMVISNLGNMH